MTLTNLIPPDIFVPGNHEFDFGKATFLQRMADANSQICAFSAARWPEYFSRVMPSRVLI